MNLDIIREKILEFFDFNQSQIKDHQKVLEEDNEKKIISIYKNQGFRIIVYNPESFAEVQNIVDQLKEGKPIILNLQDLDNDKARRIVDFVSGSVYALDGSVQKISELIFVFAPQNVNIDARNFKKNKSLFK
ncbi:MAG: cell division protein SepF [bacterium]